MNEKDKSILSNQQMAEKLERLQKQEGNSRFDLGNYEEVKVHIRPNENVRPALFQPDPLRPGGFMAHPLTIKAMRKDLFFASNDLSNLKDIYQCEKCQQELDLQFWLVCPYCETPFKLKDR